MTLVARWRWMAAPLAVFAFSRAAIFAVTGWSLVLDSHFHRPGGPFSLPAFEGLCWWDCGWFQTIARDGYMQPNWSNFFPLFPLLGRVVHEVTRLPYPYALVLVANAFGLVGLVVIYRLFCELEGEAVAKTGIALLAAWPFSFFHAAGYPESIMLASTAVAIWYSYRSRHFAAGTALGIGILGRHLTIVAGLSLLVAQIKERGWRPRRLIWHPHFLALLVPFAIASLYFVYLSVHFGDPLSWWRARSSGWGAAAWYGVQTYFYAGPAAFEPQIGIYIVLSLIPGIAAFFLARKQSWWILGGFGIGLMVALWAIGLMGLGRYTQACWPAFLPIAVALEKRPSLRMPVILAFALVQGMFLYLFTHSYPIN
jgi:hypothetical protein